MDKINQNETKLGHIKFLKWDKFGHIKSKWDKIGKYQIKMVQYRDISNQKWDKFGRYQKSNKNLKKGENLKYIYFTV